jgi:hypothetical protein
MINSNRGCLNHIGHYKTSTFLPVFHDLSLIFSSHFPGLTLASRRAEERQVGVRLHRAVAKCAGAASAAWLAGLKSLAVGVEEATVDAGTEFAWVVSGFSRLGHEFLLTPGGRPWPRWQRPKGWQSRTALCMIWLSVGSLTSRMFVS